MHELTELQQAVLSDLRSQNCHFIAAAAEREWKAGNRYYIDTRVRVRGIRRRFEQCNKQAEAVKS